MTEQPRTPRQAGAPCVRQTKDDRGTAGDASITPQECGAAESLFEKNLAWAEAFARSWIKNRKIKAWRHDELVQAARIALWKACQKYEDNRSCSLHTYARDWVLGALCEELKGRSDLLSPTGGLEEEISTPDTSHQVDSAEELRSCLVSLDDRAQRILKRQYFDGATLEEISKEEGRAPSTIQRIAKRALKKAQKHGGLN